ncbi:hypothetical protein [Alphaspiravirus yamagawaense]|uniref:Uncharacterized protein n=1 Tax=Alphaspiravirus yamagawaense TaxID=1157339 RepID=J7Q210_9VIRU|nr:hypothetical protein [Aeropyrum coil-shaped virus]CCG27850.1 hypothetical protein [Aeropyrum coil-shaped virus]
MSIEELRSIDVECIFRLIEEYASYLPEGTRSVILENLRNKRIADAKAFVEGILGEKIEPERLVKDNSLKPVLVLALHRCGKGGQAPSKALQGI